MASIQIIDTFPQFLAIWPSLSHLATEEIIDGWDKEYISKWSDLRQLQIDDYTGDGFDWRQIARDKVFPYLHERMPAMLEAHDSLLDNCAGLFHKAQARLNFETDVIIVIYVGIGCGAGWVTTFRNNHAILFGLENIAECGYQSPPIINGLVAHEIGHVAHFHLRSKNNCANGTGPWWQLYSEGFAQRCEHITLGCDLWHMKVANQGQEWLTWCRRNKARLAATYLERINSGEPVNDFFGSWYDIDGYSQTGYFLGHEVIAEMNAELPLAKLALLEGPLYGMEQIVERIARA